MSSVPEEKTRKTSPEIGEHNLEIFKGWLNYSDEEIEQLRKEGVI